MTYRRSKSVALLGTQTLLSKYCLFVLLQILYIMLLTQQNVTYKDTMRVLIFSTTFVSNISF